MRLLKSLTLLLLIMLSLSPVLDASELKIVNIGDFETTGGDIIKDTRLAYRTLGTLNTDKTNVVLWPTWFTGTSEDVLTSGMLVKTLDTRGLYVVIVDALANGVSSSPSNTEQFPDITIRDMVNSQHQLLVEQLGIKHVRAIIGMSMGGLQTYEWLVSYPDFMDKAIPIEGTPKLSSFDVLVWQTQIDLLSHAKADSAGLDFALKKAYDIFYMNLTTPTDFARRLSASDVHKYMAKKYDNMIDARDYLASMKAMMQHNIYKSANRDMTNIKQVIKADVLTIVSESDHLVNPINSIALANVLGAKALLLTGIKGHMAAFIQTQRILAATTAFLKE